MNGTPTRAKSRLDMDVNKTPNPKHSRAQRASDPLDYNGLNSLATQTALYKLLQLKEIDRRETNVVPILESRR